MTVGDPIAPAPDQAPLGSRPGVAGSLGAGSLGAGSLGAGSLVDAVLHATGEHLGPGSSLEWAGVDAGGLRTAARAIRCAISALEHQERLVLAEIGTRRAFTVDGSRDVADWSANNLGISRRVANEQVQLAEQLADMPRLADAAAAGAVTREQARPAADLARAAGTDVGWAAQAPHLPVGTSAGRPRSTVDLRRPITGRPATPATSGPRRTGWSFASAGRCPPMTALVCSPRSNVGCRCAAELPARRRRLPTRTSPRTNGAPMACSRWPRQRSRATSTPTGPPSPRLSSWRRSATTTLGPRPSSRPGSPSPPRPPVDSSATDACRSSCRIATVSPWGSAPRPASSPRPCDGRCCAATAAAGSVAAPPPASSKPTTWCPGRHRRRWATWR